MILMMTTPPYPSRILPIRTQQFGYEDFLLKLTGPKAQIATSKLGLGYAKGPGGIASLFAPSEGRTAEIVDLKVYVVAK